MRLAYAGTSSFGAMTLRALLSRGGHDVVLVVTRPDRPRGRHGTPQPSPVKEVALEAALPILQPERFDEAALHRLLETRPDVFVVCAYGEILGSRVLHAIPTLVVHPSALPRWRGAAPVQRALMAGETTLGVAILQMAEQVDAGPIGRSLEVRVPADADSGRAFELLAPAAVTALLQTLAAIDDGTIVWAEQTGTPSLARKITKDDRRIDWHRDAQEIVDQVRALSPAVGARTQLAGRDVIIWRAAALEEPPDSTDSDRLVVPAGRGCVEILELQAPGGKRQSTATFLRGAGRWLTGR
jgi:methionyl-tRNA formyltransferase